MAVSCSASPRPGCNNLLPRRQFLVLQARKINLPQAALGVSCSAPGPAKTIYSSPVGSFQLFQLWRLKACKNNLPQVRRKILRLTPRRLTAASWALVSHRSPSLFQPLPFLPWLLFLVFCSAESASDKQPIDPIAPSIPDALSCASGVYSF